MRFEMKRFLCLIVTAVLCLSLCICASGEEKTDEIDETTRSAVSKIFGETDDKVNFSGEFLDNAGTSASDWFVVALDRLGIDADYDGYLSALSVYVKEKYQTEGKLHPVKATEWHRISLAVSACGGNPADFAGIDLIGDGVTLRDFEKQGINAYIWGLIALDSVSYDAEEKREEIVKKLLSAQLSDGGFALSGTMGDADVTAMTLIALAPYKEREEVSSAVENALGFLSENQLSDGGFMSYGIENCESSAQVVTALCSLGINPFDDERFVKGGNSPFDAMMSYELSNGGFSHLLSDEKMNGLATEQALVALAAAKRYLSGEGGVYVFDGETQKQADFSDTDREFLRNISGKVQASDLGSLKRILEALEAAKPDDYDAIKIAAETALSQAEKLSESINKLCADIESLNEKGVKLSDKSEVSRLREAYVKLSDNDKKLVSNYETLEKLEAEINGKVREIVISAALAAVVAVSAAALVIRRRKRRKNED